MFLHTPGYGGDGITAHSSDFGLFAWMGAAGLVVCVRVCSCFLLSFHASSLHHTALLSYDTMVCFCFLTLDLLSVLRIRVSTTGGLLGFSHGHGVCCVLLLLAGGGHRRRTRRASQEDWQPHATGATPRASSGRDASLCARVRFLSSSERAWGGQDKRGQWAGPAGEKRPHRAG